jgi:hypothetical protein
LPVATTTTLGGVKPDGTTILVDATGKISTAGTSSLPIATTTTLGGVKPDGSTITVDGTGKIASTGSQQQNKIIFAEISPLTNTLNEIWIANYDGSNLTKIPVPTILPSGFGFEDISMSPDGQTIFIAGNDGSGNISQVYSMTSAGANAKKIISYDGFSGGSSTLSKFHVY